MLNNSPSNPTVSQRLFSAIRRSLPIIILGIYFPLQIFALLALTLQAKNGIFDWDATFLLTLHQTATPQQDQIASFLTNFGAIWGVAPFAFLVSLILLIQKRWRSFLFWSITLLGSYLINLNLKVYLHRLRPHLWESSYPPHLDYGFPSGHSMASMTFTVALLILMWKTPWRNLIAVLGSLFVVAIAWTRLYLGVHYPSDILGGWMLSIAWALGITLIIQPNYTSPQVEKDLESLPEDPTDILES